MTHSEAALPISLWWAIGVPMVAAAPIATVWNIDGGNGFWWAIAAIATVGALAQPVLVASGFRWPGSVLFAACYPLAIAGALTRAAVADGQEFGQRAAVGLLLAVAVASLAIVGAAVASIMWFRWLTVAWWLVSAALFFVYGLGLGFVPLALASGLTVKSLGRADGDSEVPGVR